ncbi:cytochrome P450 [Zhengella sp. ZM62]|uniref:cytochrome P450 n=1 Tax=Zhengella sedimenti TaxID=3390035 RepID=UPI003975D57A
MKYFEAIREAQRNGKPAAELPPFDMSRLETRSLTGRLVSRFLENPRWALRLLRRFWPVARIGPVTVVTRHADVIDVLERQDEFQTPFGPEMAEMALGCNFILGMQDGPEYRQMKAACLKAFPPEEVEQVVRPVCARLAGDVMQRAEPGFNAVHDLLKIVPVRICRDYFGLVIDDEERFADWSIALSSLFFADYFGNRAVRELAVVAADGMNRTIAASIAEVRQGRGRPDTPLARLVALHEANPARLPEEAIHSIMMGMVSGFVPTDLLAGGNCLDVILSRREAQSALEEAVAARDDKLVDAVIIEAMRFKPINIGPLRHCPRDAVIAPGTPRERVVKAGSMVMPATFSAMFDAGAVDDPEEFRPGRDAGSYLVFGHGIHWCIGSRIARVQIAECLKVLFARDNVRRMPGRAGRLVRRGAFPRALHVGFDRPAADRLATQTMATVVVPVAPGTPLGPLRAMADGLGNPAREDVAAALDDTGIVHFMSLAVICKADEAGETPQDKAHLVLELSADGPLDRILEKLAVASEAFLRPVFEAAGALGRGEDFQAFLRRHHVPVGPFPGTASGLVFSGTPGHSVRRIRDEARLYDTVEGMVRSITGSSAGDALQIIGEVRRRLSETAGFSWALRPADSLLEQKAPGTWSKALLGASEPRRAIVVFLFLAAIGTALNYALVFGAPGSLASLGAALKLVSSLVAAAVVAVLGLAIILALAGLALSVALNRAEARDMPSDELPPFPRYEAVVERENRLGTQNHLTGLSVMKAGWLRRLALRVSFFIIRFAAVYVFRPGYLGGINTIHFARWVLLPGTDRLVFFSNYGGSWESYLEDFITKAHYGLTGVWSNTLGFPRSRNLFRDGASDGDRFKRWARNQQIPTLFWYCAYPGLDTRRIRVNSAIRQGLVHADTGQEARDWLANFGSIPRPDGVLETHEIQSLMFGPMGRLAHGRALAFMIPDEAPRAGRKAFLEMLLAGTRFGDRLPEGEAVICAFGPAGLERLGLEPGVGGEPLAAFPPAFRQNMDHPSRARILDDAGPNAPGEWEWGDARARADVLLLLYAEDEARLSALLRRHDEAARDAGLLKTCDVALAIDRRDGQAVEPFGFADGISQPVIEGTPRARAMNSDPMHRVAAGEFILGYRDQRGHVPPAIVIPPSRDPGCILPVAMEPAGARDPGPGLPRDFGRNGSFLVVRHLAQDVEGFDGYCREAAAGLRHTNAMPEATPEWVAAKMMGRWQNGSSLVRNPHAPGEEGREPDNGFRFGPEDPQGLHCPLGSHIRRSNPRDSLGLDRETMIDIGKRHRILRVGRNYRRPHQDGGEERGLFFMCLNADIERQFEFVQQTWISAPLFHGLMREKDPVIGRQDAGARFTIPTLSGGIALPPLPSFVSLRGGGYFFMPSRSALAWMASRL